MTSENRCHQITSDGSQEESALKSTHEEADGRLFLHAAHAAAYGYPSVLISSDDTDVFIMCLAFQDNI